MRNILISSFLAALLVSCSSGKSSSGNEDSTGVLDSAEQALFQALFAAPTGAELAKVNGEWAGGDRSGLNAELLLRDTLSVDTVSADSVQQNEVWIIRHTSDGFRHYGAMVFPAGSPDTLPVLLLCHWGDGGVSLKIDVNMILRLAKGLSGKFGIVIPSFRSETLTLGDSSWTSEGSPSPWRGDVLDGLRLVSAAESLAVSQSGGPFLRADSMRTIGFSRGGGVALLAALRDPRVIRVVDYFGPTDFFGEYVQNVVRRIMLDSAPDLPGLNDLRTSVIEPLRTGALSVDSARMELLRRSPARFASKLPPLMIHHGDVDTMVAITQSDALWANLQSENAAAWAHSQYYVYPNAGHSPFPMVSKFIYSVQFLLTGDTASVAMAKRVPPMVPQGFRFDVPGLDE